MSRKETIIGFMILCIVSFVILAGWKFFFPESNISFYECFFVTMLAMSIYEIIEGRDD